MASILALGFTGAFISAALAGGGCDNNPSGGNDNYTCKDTSDGDITTGDGNDSVSVDNSDVGNIDTGNNDDLIQSTGPTTSNDFIYNDDPSGFSTICNVNAGEGNNTINIQNSIIGNDDLFYGNDTLLGDGITVGSGNNSIDIGHSLVGSIQGGDGNNTLNVTDGALVGITTLGNGDNQVTVSNNSIIYGIETGSGNDSVAVDPTSGVIYAFTGDGDDTIDVNSTALLLDAGNGNDHVTINGDSGYFFIPITDIEGGDGYDVLTFKFTVGSQKQKDTFGSLVDGGASSGTLYFGGHYYAWENFEELEFLLRVAAASGNSDVEVAVLGDSRLNAHDMAAPIAVYCKAGQVEGWVIDPATGNGNQQFTAPLSAFPTSSNGVDGSINGDQATITYAGYSYSFPVGLCP